MGPRLSSALRSKVDPLGRPKTLLALEIKSLPSSISSGDMACNPEAIGSKDGYFDDNFLAALFTPSREACDMELDLDLDGCLLQPEQPRHDNPLHFLFCALISSWELLALLLK